ncbi:MAG: SUMF1/EgtB/PvdO family nonheme iron enzyme [Tannerellaceae bacterium]|jgi:hypothetical protein|nr:SUMF1/EgtB/PvdO family nonheme iron enzyme [Tannerellaceae bacterium]
MMKNIWSILFLLATLAGCTKDNEKENTLAVSQNNVEFTVAGGEQIVDITGNAAWDCAYTEDWLLVRQQQSRIRIIVGPNTSGQSRTAVVRILCEGNTKEEIHVEQKGTELNVEQSGLSAASAGEKISVPISCNTEWSVENPVEWCSVEQTRTLLSISVSRNFRMQERSGTIVVKAGEVTREISIKQSACRWFESIETVAIDAGVFLIGAQKSNTGGNNYDSQAYQVESPVHQVRLGKYTIGKYEVTQAQWIAAMGENPSIVQGDNHPVENVTWEQVQAFIVVLNEASGLHYRLPTEAEWEYAAIGGASAAGNKYSGNPVLGACGWYYSNSGATTHEVGRKAANELGIYDMSGNVREWCNDWFDYYSSADAENPQGPDSGSTKVNRGGSWTTPAVNCRNTYRHADYPTEASQDLGFRLVVSD